MVSRSVALVLLAAVSLPPGLAQADQQPYGQTGGGYGSQQPNGGQTANGSQSPYGIQPPYGTQTPYGAQPPYGTQAPYGTRPPARPNYNLPQPQVTDIPPLNPTPTGPGRGVPLDPPGYGWCRYVDDTDKKTFYSAPFPGAPRHDVTPRDQAFTDFIHRAYPGMAGGATCQWRPADSAYDSGVREEESESNDQLRNYKMIRTMWKPSPI